MASPSRQVQARIRLSGRVQGVGFRDFACRYAHILGLSGYVRNLPDGHSVEVVAEGDKQAVLEFLNRLKVGPQGAIVKDMNVEWTEPEGIYQSFEVRF